MQLRFSELTDADLSNDSFRWLTGQEISVAGKPVRALRVNYVGELGWELHPEMADLPVIYDAIWKAGEAHGIADFGLYAVNSMRIEKAYRGWGAELTNEVTMIDADMQRFIKLDKDDFTGKAATLAQDNSERTLQLIYFEVDATDSDVRGNEPIYCDGEVVGLTTSGGYGHYCKKSLGFGYVPPALANIGSNLQVGLLDERHQISIIENPVHDPANKRMRA